MSTTDKQRHYGSPRWSSELTDCSMPLTFDTYSFCAYSCSYCFATNRKEIGNAKAMLSSTGVLAVDVDKVKRMFTAPEKHAGAFATYILQRRTMQWGGMSDPFDEYERRRGTTLELLRFFQSIKYPLCFSTKATWWTEDDRYVQAFAGMPWNVKFSLITLEARAARLVEAGCPSPMRRLDAMARAAAFAAGGVTLRLRPYIIGLTDRTVEPLIAAAARAGATALSTEFFCLELRSRSGVGRRYHQISEAVGFDVTAFYKKHSTGGGYLRLNRELKRPYVDRMQQLCTQHGLRFYVSDLDFKERCAGSSCCGLPEQWTYSRGQFTEALLLAKRDGQVAWPQVAKGMDHFKGARSTVLNFGTSERRSQFKDMDLFQYLHWLWNHPTASASPYKLFRGLLVPASVDEDGDVVYRYDATRE